MSVLNSICNLKEENRITSTNAVFPYYYCSKETKNATVALHRLQCLLALSYTWTFIKNFRNKDLFSSLYLVLVVCSCPRRLVHTQYLPLGILAMF